jgi:hypothetical protein
MSISALITARKVIPMLSAMPTPRIIVSSMRQRPSAFRSGYGSRKDQAMRGGARETVSDGASMTATSAL